MYLAQETKQTLLQYQCMKQRISIKTQANLSSFLIRKSFTSSNSKPGNDAAVDDKRSIFSEYRIDEEASGQVEVDIYS